MKTLVIIPTFNERQNIDRLIPAVLGQNIDGLEILIVDDHSPDGTGECVAELAKNEPRLHLLQREKKLGLGTAYVAGFTYALQSGFDFIVEMDADFSHDPRDLPRLLEAAHRADLVIGSRYINGVNVVNWPLSRLLLSVGASTYTRLITGMPIRDCTSGFKCFRARVLESIDLQRIQSDGYSFQIEMNFRAWKRGYRIREVSIIFTDRVAGASKMSKRIVREAIWMVWKLKFMSLFGRL
ncbi:MAG TPA: polyprenol monophosphomannose synthase [bacterium]|jgi:dolichol-phosphate mannosyltransferase|nr:polyprenol monophosphomannose synthase [bacterium]HPG45521.1 polyprenol monophosphomannose synthase [bacterium]HPM97700.1 polyprenol monophosphomannose synthase [bacterium]